MPIHADDVCLNKGAIIERAVRRALVVYANELGVMIKP
jgi:hypothetical protein